MHRDPPRRLGAADRRRRRLKGAPRAGTAAPRAGHHPPPPPIRRRRSPRAASWKIAYADFMTAMMAFFLVMWLINATDQETREVVATYFNPIRLAEATSDRKGLRDPEESSQGVDLEERSEAPVTEADEQVVGAPPRVENERPVLRDGPVPGPLRRARRARRAGRLPAGDAGGGDRPAPGRPGRARARRR